MDQEYSQQADVPSPNDLSKEAFREAERYQLGRPFQRYKDIYVLSPGMMMCLVCGAIFLLGAFWFLLLGLISPADADASHFMFIVFAVITLIYLLGALIFYAGDLKLQPRPRMRKLGYLCTDGFLIMRASGVLAAVRWDEIKEVRSGIGVWESRDQREWLVITKENERIIIPTFVDILYKRKMGQLGQQVELAFKRLHP